jgi:hypothetical protein
MVVPSFKTGWSWVDDEGREGGGREGSGNAVVDLVLRYSIVLLFNGAK